VRPGGAAKEEEGVSRVGRYKEDTKYNERVGVDQLNEVSERMCVSPIGVDEADLWTDTTPRSAEVFPGTKDAEQNQHHPS
jgi:hypothetical protein